MALRLHWWDSPGRGAEPTRLALTLKGIDFEDKRYSRESRNEGIRHENEVKVRSLCDL